MQATTQPRKLPAHLVPQDDVITDVWSPGPEEQAEADEYKREANAAQQPAPVRDRAITIHIHK